MKRGQHHKQGETKIDIFRLILSQPTAEIEEPAIRKYLKEKENISDAKTIKINHLAKLQKMGCIKKHETRGLPNRWAIESIDHVCKIFEKYEELRPDLRRNDAVVDMLLKKHLPIVKEPNTHKFFKYVIEVSPTFFEICLKHSSETLSEILEKLIESKWIQIFDTKNPFYASDINPHLENFEIKDKPLLTLFYASLIADILNHYNPDFNYDIVRNPNWIKFDKDMDKVNFMSHLPTVEMSVKLLDESGK